MTDEELQHLLGVADWSRDKFERTVRMHGGNRAEAEKTLRAAAKLWEGGRDARRTE